MKVSELPKESIQEGMMVAGLKTGKVGVVILIDDDNYCWILWEDENRSYEGWYGNNCQCEVLEGQADFGSYQEARTALLELIRSGKFQYST